MAEISGPGSLSGYTTDSWRPLIPSDGMTILNSAKGKR